MSIFSIVNVLLIGYCRGKETRNVLCKLYIDVKRIRLMKAGWLRGMMSNLIVKYTVFCL